MELVRQTSPFSGNILTFCRECDMESEKKAQKEKEVSASKELQNKINSKIQNAMITPRFKGKSFADFRVENDGQRKALEVCNWFLENWNKSMGLIFLGGPGTGKNHLASALVCKFITEKDKTALMTEAIKIIRAIKESWRSNEKTETQAIESFITPDLLVIDELGVQFGSDTERLYLTEIINDRYNWMKPTILIGNLELEELRKTIGERAFERFKEGGRVVPFTWESYRGKRLQALAE